MGRPKKKYALFLVEGYTDIEVLSAPINAVFESGTSPDERVEPYFCTLKQGDQVGGDITSSHGVNTDNIEGLISKLFVDPFLEKNPFIYPKEICEIVQIVDLDGAFVHPDRVVECSVGNAGRNTIYYEDHIETINVDNIRERNERKKENLCKLCELKEIIIRPKNARNTKKVKYSVYYFSCNMDHVIHGKLNLTQQEKVKLADDFSVDCSYEPELFKKRIFDDQVAFGGDVYSDSWNYIMTDTESLKRHTNLNLLVQRING